MALERQKNQPFEHQRHLSGIYGKRGTIMGQNVSGRGLPPGDFQTRLLGTNQICRGLIIGDGIKSAHGRRLIGVYCGLLTVPGGAKLVCRFGFFFYFGQQVVIAALQEVVVPCATVKIENKLSAGDYGDRDAKPCGQLRVAGGDLIDSAGATDNDNEIEGAVDTIKILLSGNVIKRVAQHRVPQLEYRWFIFVGHNYSPCFFVPPSFGAGWALTPLVWLLALSLLPVEPVLILCVDFTVDGFFAITFVSIWFGHLGMIGPRRFNAQNARGPINTHRTGPNLCQTLEVVSTPTDLTLSIVAGDKARTCIGVQAS
ncbi:MAG: hypothetical protein JKY32_07775 [Rhizobiales bacterium]|nr:hypothetical protein [Hyphomicrobiales bacterium]